MPHIIGHDDDYTAPTYNYTPTQWETGFGATMDELYSPAQQFAQFRTGFRPQWQYQVPLSRLQDRLTARYQLGNVPFADATQPSWYGANNTFRDYLGSVMPGEYRQSPAQLRARAEEAYKIANMTDAELAASATYGDPDSPGGIRWASYRDLYGGQNALQNQMNLVNLLAMQRPEEYGGGEYTGRMANAIQNMLGSLFTARQEAGRPGSEFLRWYLDQTA